jgi:hypothetical protein
MVGSPFQDTDTFGFTHSITSISEASGIAEIWWLGRWAHAYSGSGKVDAFV